MLALTALLVTSAPPAQAITHVGSALPEYYRGVRAMGMGGAVTALSDDADSVFYNPAGIALNSLYDFRLLNPKIDVSADDLTVLTDLKGAASKIDGPTLTKLFGKHIYGDASVFPSLVFPGFTFGYYYDAQTHIVSRNLALPAIDAQYTRDMGMVGGVAHEFQGFSKHHFLRVGGSVKWLTREGFHKVIPLTELVTADKTYLSKLNSVKATGWSGSLGMQYEIGLSRSNDLILATAWQDIGDTRFGNDLQANRPPDIRNNLSAGGAFVHRFSPSFRARDSIKVAAEMRNMSESGIDPRLKMHVGAELTLGDLSIQGGLSQDSLCAGVKLDMWFVEVSAVTYGIENQSLAFMDRERRYMLQATFKFDVMGKGSRAARDEDRRKHPRDYK